MVTNNEVNWPSSRASSRMLFSDPIRFYKLPGRAARPGQTIGFAYAQLTQSLVFSPAMKAHVCPPLHAGNMATRHRWPHLELGSHPTELDAWRQGRS